MCRKLEHSFHYASDILPMAPCGFFWTVLSAQIVWFDALLDSEYEVFGREVCDLLPLK